MPARMFKDQLAVNNRLEQLRLTREKLLEVVEAMVGARADCTPNDPPGAAGWSAYRMGTRRLREVLLSDKDWEKDEIDGIPGVINKKLGIRIAVANTDELTGLEINGCIPQNRRKKGAATDRVVHANQGSFMDVLDASLKVVRLTTLPKATGPVVTYYVCSYSEGDECRAELSCPSEMGNGFFTDFVERIILIGPNNGAGGGVRRRTRDNGDGGSEGEGSEFDIPVTRKK